MNGATKKISIACTSTKTHGYDVTIGDGAVSAVQAVITDRGYSAVLAFVDPNVSQHPLLKQVREVCSKVVVLPHYGEAVKTYDSLAWILQQCMQHRLDRKSAVLAIGGGAVGDAVSFAASLYMRGIAVVQLPSTLLAMVDSSVGGKTAINFGAVKNLIGSFLQPDAVCVDPAFLSTLPAREFSSGIAEIIKHACIEDGALVQQLLDQRLNECDQQTLSEIIARSITTKKNIVEQDPTEQHIRKILNFGHTVGHALERCSHETKEPLLHGEAVAQGMLIESLIAMKLNRQAREVLDTLVRLYRFQGISTDIASFDEDKLMRAMLLDKKNQSGVLRFSLSFAVGSCSFDQEVPREVVLQAYRDALANTGLLF